MINAAPPTNWRDLQQQVARILRECGLEADVERPITTVRETVNIDVYAEDPAHSPRTVYLCECKHWQTAVPKSVVHAFRTVVADHGANWGFIISSAGFQSGAFEAAANTNVRLVAWNEFQNVFVDRWFENYMLGRLREVAEPLVDYTEPENCRVFRKAGELSPRARQRFGELRREYADLAFLAQLLYVQNWGQAKRMQLPLKAQVRSGVTSYQKLPDELLEATSHRGFLDILCRHLRSGIAQFDEVFGGRA
jgi:hypothetical protein